MCVWLGRGRQAPPKVHARTSLDELLSRENVLAVLRLWTKSAQCTGSVYRVVVFSLSKSAIV